MVKNKVIKTAITFKHYQIDRKVIMDKVKEIPNDMELGEVIRKYVNSL